MTEQQRDAITAAKDLTGALDGLSQRLDDAKEEWAERDKFLTAYGKRNRLMTWLASTAAVIALGLAVAVAILYVRTADNAATIGDLHASSVSSCQGGNVTRASEIALWNHLAAAAKPAPGETAAERQANEKAVAAFLRYVRRVLAPRDCTALYGPR